MMAKAALGLCLAAMMASGANAATLPPVDECGDQPGFEVYRTALSEAIAARDLVALESLASPDIQTGFGASDIGAESLAERAKEPAFWSALEEMLQLGCARDEQSLSIPYMALRFPEGRNAYENVLTKGVDIPLYASPDANAEVLASLSWELLTLDWKNDPRGPEAESWARVRTDDGKTGYVRREMLRSPISYRALFRQVDGRWQMTALVAGD